MYNMLINWYSNAQFEKKVNIKNIFFTTIIENLVCHDKTIKGFAIHSDNGGDDITCTSLQVDSTLA